MEHVAHRPEFLLVTRKEFFSKVNVLAKQHDGRGVEICRKYANFLTFSLPVLWWCNPVAYALVRKRT